MDADIGISESLFWPLYMLMQQNVVKVKKMYPKLIRENYKNLLKRMVNPLWKSCYATGSSVFFDFRKCLSVVTHIKFNLKKKTSR